MLSIPAACSISATNSMLCYIALLYSVAQFTSNTSLRIVDFGVSMPMTPTAPANRSHSRLRLRV